MKVGVFEGFVFGGTKGNGDGVVTLGDDFIVRNAPIVESFAHRVRDLVDNVGFAVLVLIGQEILIAIDERTGFVAAGFELKGLAVGIGKVRVHLQHEGRSQSGDPNGQSGRHRDISNQTSHV